MEEEDLGFSEEPTRGPRGARIEFPDFPEMRPLDPRRDEPWRFDDEEREDHTMVRKKDVFDPSGVRWILAAAGAGKTFFARWHQLRGEATALAVETLSRAMPLLPEKGVVIIDVHHPDPVDDAVNFRRLRKRGHVYVLASWPPPDDVEELERSRQRGAEILGYESPQGARLWNRKIPVIEWRMTDENRRRFVYWCSQTSRR